MNQPPSDPYFDVLLRSGLINRGKLMQIISELERETGTEAVDKAVVEKRLLDGRLITSWQNDKIRQGKFTGFFVGKYKLLRPLGKGGMGAVYLAEHTSMQRQVAIKILPPALLENRTYLVRFQQEARATAALDHPNVVRAYDTDQDGAFHYLVMEFVEGQELQKLVEKNGPLPYDDAANYITQAARGLAHAHSRKMIHRDVKPANILVTPDGLVKVLDLGVARIVDQEDRESVTLAGNDDVIGTVDYIAPEQLLDSHHVDGRADQYSLGCTMYFLLTANRPFEQGSWAVRLMKHQNAEPPSIYDFRPDAPPELVDICRKMMAKKPDQRFESADAVADALHAWRERFKQGKAAPAPAAPQAPAPAAAGAVDPQAAAALLAQLVAQSVLTPYQVEILTGQSKDPLKLDDYQIIERITEGRLKGLFRGRHSDMKFPVTIKLMKLEGEAGEKKMQLARFQREARIAVQAHHSNIIRTFEVGKAEDVCFLTFEDMQGETLAELLAKANERRLSPHEACRIIRQAALGLGHLHEMEIVHRNVSPDNIWVGKDGTSKLFDLSLARDSLMHLDSPGLTEFKVPETLWGSTKYLAPEHGFDTSAATAASDVYSLGCTLYQAVSGRIPFEAATPAEQMMQHAAKQADPPSRWNTAVSPALDTVIQRMMAKLPAERYATGADVAMVLQAFA